MRHTLSGDSWRSSGEDVTVHGRGSSNSGLTAANQEGGRVLARPFPKGTVPFGGSNVPFGSAPKPTMCPLVPPQNQLILAAT